MKYGINFIKLNKNHIYSKKLQKNQVNVNHKAKIRVIFLMKEGEWNQGKAQRENSEVLIVVLSLGDMFARVDYCIL